MAEQRVAILGLGLIGSSLGLALKHASAAATIIGFDPSQAARDQARRQGAVDRLAPSAVAACEGAEVVVLAAPVRAILQLLGQIGDALAADTLVTDTGGAKQEIVRQAERALPASVGFVGGHPLAGRLRAGAAQADARLFVGSIYCLTPTPSTPAWAVERATQLAEAVGAEAHFLDPGEHDGLLAAVSHLPYLAAAALTNALGAQDAWPEMARLASGGFRTATSLLDASPDMWADVALINREPIVRQLDALIAHLSELRQLVEGQDAAGVSMALGRAHQLRQAWLESHGEPTSRPLEPAPRSKRRFPFFR